MVAGWLARLPSRATSVMVTSSWGTVTVMRIGSLLRGVIGTAARAASDWLLMRTSMSVMRWPVGEKA